MKLACLMVALFVGGFLAIDYGSKYMMGGVEAGLPNGGHGHYADYHENNVFSYWLSDYDETYRPSYLTHERDDQPTLGQAATNPFVKTP